ncbi:hypothetical protein [Aliicoccus persicus]|uniref:Uncharacterized protein n=1 Tax=Aliicoccus persicus TaxID=930138 RepID=A0A662Z493_9STAP|nr:hypothetical protein [Aliicoccus persicus]SEW10621.1 hypothetical protein SAMN05192557_1617 [Aliicoccus persicus]
MKKLLCFAGFGLLISSSVYAQDTELLEDFDSRFYKTAELVEQLSDVEQTDIELSEILAPRDEVTSYYFEFLSQFTSYDSVEEFEQPLETTGIIVEDGDTLEIIEGQGTPENLEPVRYGDAAEGVAIEYTQGTESYIDLQDYGLTTEDLILHRYDVLHDLITAQEESFTSYETDTHYVLENVTEDADFGSSLDNIRSIYLQDFEALNYNYGLIITIDKETGYIEESIILTSADIPEIDGGIVSELYAKYDRYNEVESIYDDGDYAEVIEIVQANLSNVLQNFFEDNPGHSSYIGEILYETEGFIESDVDANELLDELDTLERYEFIVANNLVYRDMENMQITSASDQSIQGYIAEEDDFLSVQAFRVDQSGNQVLYRYGNTEQDVVWLNDSMTEGVFQDTSQYGVEEVMYFRYDVLHEALSSVDGLVVHETDENYYLSLENDAQLEDVFNTLQYTVNDGFIEGTDSYGIVTMINKETNYITDTILYRKMDAVDGDNVTFLEVMSGYRENTDFEDTIEIEELE